MHSFIEVNKTRTTLKMNLSNYSWYLGSRVELRNGELTIKVLVKKINDKIKKIVPHILDGIEISLEQ